jgi:hypothetical protein
MRVFSGPLRMLSSEARNRSNLQAPSKNRRRAGKGTQLDTNGLTRAPVSVPHSGRKTPPRTSNLRRSMHCSTCASRSFGHKPNNLPVPAGVPARNPVESLRDQRNPTYRRRHPGTDHCLAQWPPFSRSSAITIGSPVPGSGCGAHPRFVAKEQFWPHIG